VIAAGSLLDLALAERGFSVPVGRIEKVFSMIPRLAGSKFSYSRVDREERSRELSRALDLLRLAGVANRVRHSSANGVPLGAEAVPQSGRVPVPTAVAWLAIRRRRSGTGLGLRAQTPPQALDLIR
jgi:hypothetical protein